MPFGSPRASTTSIDESGKMKVTTNSDTRDSLEDERMSYFTMLTTSPSDWQLILNEKLALIDWDAKASTLAQPCGNALTILFFIIRLLQDNLIKPNFLKLNAVGDAFDFAKSEKLRRYDYLLEYSIKSGNAAKSKGELYFISLGRLARILDVSIKVLIVWNILSTYRFLCVFYKTYSLFHLQSIPKSDNLTKHSLTGISNDEARYQRLANGSLWSLVKSLFLRDGRSGQVDGYSNESKYYYKLRKWAPSKFSAVFFVSFPPTCIAFLFFSEVSFRTLFAVIIHQYLLYFLVTKRYEQRLTDDLITVSAANAEIDEKFIKPRFSKVHQDVQVDATPYGNGYVRFFPPSNKSHLFKAHSLDGSVITEQYNTDTEQFDTLSAELDVTQNTIVKPPHLHPYMFYRDPYHPHYDRFRQAGQNICYSREGSPTRMSTPPGFYSPAVSTASGMSTPYFRPERSSTFMNAVPAKQTMNNKNSVGVTQSRKGSKSPLRLSLLSTRNSGDEDIKRMRIPKLSLSSRSSSKSPTR
ncbi:hypothetical protein HG535_0D01200 [Zygotorulaspora mrakii]|uniref:Nuclear rim protein 1 n=1 Tax=Zygotorulaspora mrakii TaxID=42260 RepID=A0A7H9B3T5_ZYGMR|nr:uncharacterized protein HG535_0D01200 [Zygotorulaspora mrakii]QLG72412.1 hypothetical protein HG535_0D01200 [Zygotorulaspora mrakii]